MLRIVTIILAFLYQAILASAEDYVNPAPRGDLISIARKVLDETPELRDFLFSSLEFDDIGHSAFIWTDPSSPVQGERVGPFWLFAKPAGSPGPATFQIIMNIEKTYYDDKGHQIEHLRNAHRVKQTVEGIQIIPLETPDSQIIGTWVLVKSGGLSKEQYVSAKWKFLKTRRCRRETIIYDGSLDVFDGYFINEKGKIQFGQKDSGTFEVYDYRFENYQLIIESHEIDGTLVTRLEFKGEN